MANSNLARIKIKQRSTFKMHRSSNENKKLFINFLLCLILPLCIVGALELVSRGWIGALVYLKNYPKSVVINYMILLIALSPAMLAKRSHFVSFLLSIPWVLASFVSYVLSKVRGVPFIWSDLYSAGDGMSIAGMYMSKEIILRLLVGVLIGAVLIVSTSKLKFKVYKVHFAKKLLIMVGIILLGLGGQIYLKAHGAVQIVEWDTLQSYNRNGFAYSFVDSYLATFRKAPKDYSKEAISEIMQGMTSNSGESGENGPNVIVVQLEAVFDPTTLQGVQFSKDPMANLRKRMKDNYSGRIQVPTIGGGTARTEFEVLAGVNMDYLSPGEIPYNSGMINKGPVETLAYTFKEKGYATTAIHNFEGNFYSRNTAYKNLGFDTFVTMETMNNLDRTRGYPKDGVLVDYISGALEKTDGKDFIFTIGVETHGPYDYEYDVASSRSGVKVTSPSYDSRSLAQLQDYVDRLSGTDQFVGALGDYIDSLEEETIVVMYSDHYPALDVLQDISDEEKHLTPYFIMSNTNNIVKRRNHDIEAYQLGSEMLDLMNVQGGTLNRFHTSYGQETDYLSKLELLQYDMLFGKKYSTNKENPYTPTIIQIGLEKVQIDNVIYEDQQVIITGSGFTESSHIFVKDKLIETQFVNENKIIGITDKAQDRPVIVKQLGRNDKVIASSEAYKAEE